MDSSYRLAGRVVTTVHSVWILLSFLAGLGALFCLVLTMISLVDPFPRFPELPWLAFRLTIGGAVFSLTQSIVTRVAKKIWGECPMLLLERSLLMRDCQYYDPRIKSPFCDWVARHIGLKLSPDAVVFSATIALALSINLLLFVPVAYVLFWS
ncbi:MAG: hypothetical protein V1738_00600 [Patescibacteria group bacterium]